jgi:hypothetical protein
MSSSAFADPGDLRERRYLVATLLYDAWLPRALEAELPAAERKAFYWSGIYGAARTRITEVWVQARTFRPPPRRQPAEPARPEIPTLPSTSAPAPRKRRLARWLGALARLDVPVDPAYAKALADSFLLYVGSQLALRVLANLKLAASLV